MIEFFYGMSGSLKSTTIQRRLETHSLNGIVLLSQIKPYKELEEGIFKGLTEINDLNYAINYLLSLGREVTSIYPDQYLFVERGVTDMLFYKNMRQDEKKLSDEVIKSIVDKEKEFCENNEYSKNLLIMKDRFFIENLVLDNPHRAKIFKDVDDYLQKQDEYVNFTLNYNEINNIREITDAKDYILNELNLGIKIELLNKFKKDQ